MCIYDRSRLKDSMRQHDIQYASLIYSATYNTWNKMRCMIDRSAKMPFDIFKQNCESSCREYWPTLQISILTALFISSGILSSIILHLEVTVVSKKNYLSRVDIIKKINQRLN